ncbi:hypothetical protein EDB86DRAFT_2401305 [Lactarius hatsudake]|nr:hypothetical protein EDB86DRAFT_2401305 [Lactarius hatsudake]
MVERDYPVLSCLVDVYQSQKGGWRHLKFRLMQGILTRSMRNVYERRWQGTDLVYLSTSTREWLYAINLLSCRARSPTFSPGQSSKAATPDHITMTLADVKMHSLRTHPASTLPLCSSTTRAVDLSSWGALYRIAGLAGTIPKRMRVHAYTY